MIRKVFYILFFVGVLAFTYVNREKYLSFFSALKPCDTPKTYKIDTVDPRFKLSDEKVKATVSEAANIWNGERANLFTYDENGTVSVNLIFDERQAASNKINQLEQEVETEKGKLDEQIKIYESQVADFKGRLADHNAKVQSWNSQGGAPPEEFEKLNQEQATLRDEANRLNEVAGKLNLSTQNYNLGVGKLNNAIGDFNEDIQRKPEEGLFIGETNTIEIYFVNNHPELVHTIAHELGHSIGIEHVDDEKAVMFPFTSKSVTLALDDKSALTEFCRERSPIELINTRLNRR